MTGTATAAAHRVSSPTRAPRQNNRIIMVCTALFDKDTPQWPFWKFQHLKNTRGVTDFAMLAITRQDSFVATIQNGVASTRTLKRGIKTLDTKLLSGFLDTWYRPNSYFVYGGHGCSDLLEFDDDHRLQVFDLANALGDRQFLGMLFDACVMSSLDTAYYLRKHTKVIGAAEGYMWEEDTWGENHMFNPYAASLMCRDTNSRRVMQLIGEEYTRKSRMADFSVLDTTHAESLWDCVHEKHMERIHASVHLKPEIASGEKPVDRQIYDTKVAPKFDATVPQLPALFATPAVTATGAIVPRDHEHRCNFTFPHALYPEQWDEDHIVDLGAHLKHDAEATELLNKVVVWKSGPSNASLYGVKLLSGMNVSLGQYSYQSANRPLVAHMVPPVADAAARHAKLDTPPLHAAEKRAATESITTESPTLDVTPTMAPKSTEATAKMDRHADSPRRTEGKGSPTRITSARPAPRRSAPTSPAH